MVCGLVEIWGLQNNIIINLFEVLQKYGIIFKQLKKNITINITFLE